MKTDKGETLFRVPFVLLRALIVLRPEKVEFRGEEEESEGLVASFMVISVSFIFRSKSAKSWGSSMIAWSFGWCETPLTTIDLEGYLCPTLDNIERS